MADFANTTTLDLRRSENAMPAPWVTIARSALEAAETIMPRYRKWTGSAIAEMTAGEKAAADAAFDTARRDAVAARIETNELKALVKVLLDEINLLRARVPSAALPSGALAPRTLAQFRAAVRAEVT